MQTIVSNKTNTKQETFWVEKINKTHKIDIKLWEKLQFYFLHTFSFFLSGMIHSQEKEKIIVIFLTSSLRTECRQNKFNLWHFEKHLKGSGRSPQEQNKAGRKPNMEWLCKKDGETVWVGAQMLLNVSIPNIYIKLLSLWSRFGQIMTPILVTSCSFFTLNTQNSVRIKTFYIRVCSTVVLKKSDLAVISPHNMCDLH